MTRQRAHAVRAPSVGGGGPAGAGRCVDQMPFVVTDFVAVAPPVPWAMT